MTAVKQVGTVSGGWQPGKPKTDWSLINPGHLRLRTKTRKDGVRPVETKKRKGIARDRNGMHNHEGRGE